MLLFSCSTIIRTSVAVVNTIPCNPHTFLHTRSTVTTDPSRLKYPNDAAKMADKPPPAKRIKYVSGGPQQNVRALLEESDSTSKRCSKSSLARNPTSNASPSIESFSLQDRNSWRRQPLLAGITVAKKPVDPIEHAPGVFTRSIQCVYLGSVTEPDFPEVVDEYYFGGLIALYLQADKLNDVTTTNLVIDEIMRVSEELLRLPCPYEVAWVYTSTVGESSLRKLCRDYYVYEALPVELETIHEGVVPLQLLQNVMLEFQRQTNSEDPDKRRSKVNCVDRENCCYHQHDDEHPKCL